MTDDTENTDPVLDDELPRRGRLLGIDFGTKRVGVAVCDAYQEFSSPLYNYQRSGRQADERFFCNVAAEYDVAGLVVGLPVHMSGDESQKSREARNYGTWLSRLLGVPVAYQDERYSSVHAELLMMQVSLTRKQRSARIDKLAAHILLQQFLDKRSEKKLPPENKFEI